MNEQIIKVLDMPAAWTAADYASKDTFAVDLKPSQLEAIGKQLANFKSKGGDLQSINSESFPLHEIESDIVVWRQEVREGCGMILIRGVPVESIPLEDLKLMYLGLGTHFGRPVSQNNLGDLVGDVFNIGNRDRNERAYRSSRELSLHTDRADHIAMLCIRPAISGGLSGYASGITIHNIMLQERPDLLSILYNGFYLHRFGEQWPGEPLVTNCRIPVFSVMDNIPSVIFIRGYIDLAVDEGHVTLTDLEQEALAYMDEVSNRSEVRIDFLMEPGEMMFVNNCLIMHSRTEFEDSADPALKRHLLRLWLREDDRPASKGVLMHKGISGIEKQDGKGTYYNGDKTTPPG